MLRPACHHLNTPNPFTPSAFPHVLSLPVFSPFLCFSPSLLLLLQCPVLIYFPLRHLPKSFIPVLARDGLYRSSPTATWFCNWSLIEQPYPLVYVLSIAVFLLQWQSWVVLTDKLQSLESLQRGFTDPYVIPAMKTDHIVLWYFLFLVSFLLWVSQVQRSFMIHLST